MTCERIEEWDDTANYKGSDYIGKVGVEVSYERELHGTTGVEEVEVDAGGRAVRTLSRTPPTSGNNLRLALDIKLQQVAERAFGERRGALVALDPATGEVLAFVSKPGFDPNLFVDGIDPASWDLLNDSIDKPMLNRPLRGAYPPGSTIKPFLALGALTSGKRSAAQTIFDPGYYQIAGSTHRFRDDKPGGHGSVDMYKSIVVSCDTYYYMLAADTDIDDTHAFMSQFGFGRETGIDIEGELGGVLPSREWKRERFSGKNYRDEHRKWYLGDSISAGHRPGLQRVHAAAAGAGHRDDRQRGRRHAPARGQAASRTSAAARRAQVAPQVTHTLRVKPEHLAVIKTALTGVPGRHQRAGVRRHQIHFRRARPEPRSSTRSRARSTSPARSTSACAITPGTSPTRRWTSRRSRWRCWSRTAASARRPPRRSRAPSSTITCLASRRALPLHPRQAAGVRRRERLIAPAPAHGQFLRIARARLGGPRRGASTAI